MGKRRRRRGGGGFFMSRCDKGATSRRLLWRSMFQVQVEVLPRRDQGADYIERIYKFCG